MKVLVVGQGGREHVLAWKLANAASVSEVYCAPGNAGTAADAVNVPIAANDIDALTDFARDKHIDLTVVGPEAPLVAGIVDRFQDAGLTVFGPNQKAAQLEGSKVFCKKLLQRGNIPTADFQVFDDPNLAIEYVRELPDRKLVVKADGLAAGKGVAVCDSSEEAVDAIKSIMVDQTFGAAGQTVVLEERLEGEEASILAIVDGQTIVPLESSQDHKRALDNDEGPNTGGMGAYSPTPLVTPELMDAVVERILVPTVHTMNRDGLNFRGVLYAGLMITPQGPKVLEYNVRFGDPEAQPVLMRLRSDLGELLLAAATGKLEQIDDLQWDPRPAVCIVMASGGYPGPYETGHPIRGLDQAAEVEDVKVFHAGTDLQDGVIVNNGGRVLGVTALGSSIPEAKLRAYQAVKPIRWSGAWCRKDISDKALRLS